MIDVEAFVNSLYKNDVAFFTGVPDSLLKDFCAFITDNVETKNNITAANEGAAVGLAAGYHIATGKFPLVYMQNSGLGNSINPLLSLADPDVYSIPMLLMVGWRGEPGKKDEPQHVKQGKVTIGLIEAMGYTYSVIDSDTDNIDEILSEANLFMKENNSPYFIVVKKGTFEPYKLKTKKDSSFELLREDALKIIVDNLSSNDIVVSTTGKTSRELFEYREELKQSHDNDFLTVGSMGHASQIALGIALNTDKEVFCFDGDGASIMHTGSLAITGSLSPKNYKHVIFNNGSHESVGGQPTVGLETDFCKIAEASNYIKTFSVSSRDDLFSAIKELKLCDGPALLEIKIDNGGRENLGRPTKSPIENKLNLMNLLK
ncbi:MAG: phosphonopyruvate decarboxylase [Marinifilaceae bacterium]